MARIWSMMDVGRRSLANSQTALQTTAHNVANRTTEGYSRQRVDFVTNVPIGEGKLRIGMGAKASGVTRTNDTYLEKQIEREGTQLGYYQTKSDILGRVEQVYNEQTNEGLNHSIGKFFNSLRELSNNPESLATRTEVKESADHLAKDFNHVDSQLKEIQRDADFRVQTKVNEINQITKEISQLNEKVQVVELQGVSANDERDRRDLLLKQLGDKVNIRYAEGKDGQLTITAGNTAVLVSGYSHRELQSVATPGREGKSEGNVDIFYKSTENGTPINVTGQFTGGELGGILEVRDKVCNDYIDHMDEAAYSLASNVNRTHVEGFDRYGKNGNLMFEQPDDVTGAAEKFKLSDDIANDVGKIAAAAQPNAAGDNRIANVLSSMQYQKTMDGNSATFDDFYNSLVGKIGIEAQRANSAQQSQADVVGQLKNIRESISGVSLDEETTKMIEFQKSFDASARLVRTADEMMDTILKLKQL
jgi:flagellar hook-associated protein 1